MPTEVFTDGACSGNPGPGGWAWAVEDGRFAAGPAEDTTNQRMELAAALEAVRAIDGPMVVVSDSTYVVKCFTDGWWKGWLKRGWVNSAKKPVANRDLWEPLIELVRERGDVEFRWVKGHSGHPMNDLADGLAVEAGRTQRPRSGSQLPALADLEEDTRRGPGSSAHLDDRSAHLDQGAGGRGPARTVSDPIEDGRSIERRSSRARRADGRVPPGYLVGVFGLRPRELGGFERTAHHDRVAELLSGHLAAMAQIEPDLTVLSGCRLGVEMIGAEAAARLGLRWVAVLPYPDPQAVWPARLQQDFERLLDQADSALVLERRSPRDRAAAGAALARRDGWFAKTLDEAIVVHDGRDRATAALIGRFDRALSAGLTVLEIDPVDPE